MIDQTRISAAPPTSGPQTSSPAGGKREISPKPVDFVTEAPVPTDRADERVPVAVKETDTPVVRTEDRPAYEGPRYVTQGVMHEATGRYIIRVVASSNPDDVVAQYPPEDLLRFYELARELQVQSTAPELTQGLTAV